MKISRNCLPIQPECHHAVLRFIARRRRGADHEPTDETDDQRHRWYRFGDLHRLSPLTGEDRVSSAALYHKAVRGVLQVKPSKSVDMIRGHSIPGEIKRWQGARPRDYPRRNIAGQAVFSAV